MAMTGGCQCGKARYEVTGAPVMTIACHCTDCQTISGSAFAVVMVVDEGDFRMTSGEVACFTGYGSSGGAKDGYFCPDCGSRLYHKNALRAGKVSLRAGTLDDTSGLNPEKHIWVKSKQPWVVLPEGVPVAAEQT